MSAPFEAVSHMDDFRYFALIPAAGSGSRMQSDIPKQYLDLNGRAIILHALDAFMGCAEIVHVFVVVHPEDTRMEALIAAYTHPLAQERISVLRCGGASRRDSVLAGLQAMKAQVRSQDRVLVHDAARPGLEPVLIRRLLNEVGNDVNGGLLALPVVDTVKKQTAGQVETLAREGLWLAQTPQMFAHGLLEAALQAQETVTDEASAMEAMGYVPRLVAGHLRNSKVTRPEDLEWIGVLLQGKD